MIDEETHSIRHDQWWPVAPVNSVSVKSTHNHLIDFKGSLLGFAIIMYVEQFVSTNRHNISNHLCKVLLRLEC